MSAASQNILLRAMLRNKRDLFEEAVADHADVNFIYDSVQIGNDNHRDITALRIAIEQRNTILAERLIELGADPHALMYNRSSLTQAVEKNMQALINKIADKGIDLDVPNAHGNRALEIAIFNSNKEMFELLLERGASVNPKGGLPPLAQIESYSPYIQKLIDRGADTQPKDNSGLRIALHEATCPVVQRTNQTITELLRGYINDPTLEAALIDKNQPTILLNQILSLHRLEEVFTRYIWKGHERDALEFFDTIAKTVPPHYRDSLSEIDMSALREGALSSPQSESAVERFTKRQSRTPGGRLS